MIPTESPTKVNTKSDSCMCMSVLNYEVQHKCKIVYTHPLLPAYFSSACIPVCMAILIDISYSAYRRYLAI